MQRRCSDEGWHKTIYTNPDRGVSQFIENYTFEKPLAPDGNVEYVDGAKTDGLSEAQRYRSILGSCYLSGGMELVANMLNRFDPGFHFPTYPETLHKRMRCFDQSKKDFWASGIRPDQYQFDTFRSNVAARKGILVRG